MLEYSKKILTKVSFDKSLFRKELLKAARWLRKDELKMLQMWCITTFGSYHRDVIMEVFKKFH